MNLIQFEQRLSRFRSSEMGMRLSSALLWGGISTILGRGLPLLAMILTARILGPLKFGKLTLLYSTALTFEVFVSAGLAVTCTKFVADLHRKDPAHTSQIIRLAYIIATVTAVLIGGFIVSFAPKFASDVLAAPDLTDELYWCAVLVAVLAHSSVRQGVLVGLEAFRTVASIELVGGFAILVLVPLGGTINGVKGAFIAMILGYGLRLVFQHFAVAQKTSKWEILPRWDISKIELSGLLRFGFPAMLNSLLWGPVTWCALAIIANQPNGHAEIGIFNAANQWFSLILFLPSIFTQVAFPILTERVNAGETSTAQKLFYAEIIVTLGIVSLAGLIVALLSQYIMGFYGVEYADKWTILVYVAIAACISAPQGAMGNFLMAHARPWSWFFASLVWAGCLIFVVATFRHYGAFALAWGHMTAYAVRGLYAVLFINKIRIKG